MGKFNKTKSQTKMMTLDLHGKTTDQIFDLVDSFLTKNVKAGKKQVCIMPGKGTGKVKSTLLDYLKKAGYPWEYEKSPSGKSNEGSLIIFLD
ncbi:MAG: Smr/MutS family protein [Bdellovibrionales bacterium]|nr:Smr/MutS family protein [Bdellovibrionales bacterium]